MEMKDNFPRNLLQKCFPAAPKNAPVRVCNLHAKASPWGSQLPAATNFIFDYFGLAYGKFFCALRREWVFFFDVPSHAHAGNHWGKEGMAEPPATFLLGKHG